MFKKLILSAGAAAGLALASVPAHAHGFVSVGIGVPGIVVAPAPYYAPPPVVVAPRVYAPAPYFGPEYVVRGAWGYPGWYHDGYYRGYAHYHGGWEGHGFHPGRR